MTRYELLDRIGVGGMAEIFRGKAVAAGGFEKPVAIKRILPHLSQDKRFVELLIAEAKVLSLLKHRNIVQIFDVGLGDDGQYFLVMEYVDGKDFGAVQRDQEAGRKRLPFDLALHIGAEVCEALEHAHSARAPDGKAMSLVHRDVSPSNVLLSRAGEVKLTDFGIAKRAEAEQTGHGAVRGKFAYISPEQARNEHIEPRSDVFSVGILLWEMVTGRRLFSGLGDLEALRSVREANAPRPSTSDPSLSNEIDALIMAALSRDPKRRPTAGQLGEKLRSIRYSLEITGGDPATELAKIIDAAEEHERQSHDSSGFDSMGTTGHRLRPPVLPTGLTHGTGFEHDGGEATVIRIRTAAEFAILDASGESIKAAKQVIDRFEEEETRLAQLSGDQLRLLRDTGTRDSSEMAAPPSPFGRSRRPTDEPTTARPPIDDDAMTRAGAPPRPTGPRSGSPIPHGQFDGDEATRLVAPSSRRTPPPERIKRAGTVPPPVPLPGMSARPALPGVANTRSHSQPATVRARPSAGPPMGGPPNLPPPSGPPPMPPDAPPIEDPSHHSFVPGTFHSRNPSHPMQAQPPPYGQPPPYAPPQPPYGQPPAPMWPGPPQPQMRASAPDMYAPRPVQPQRRSAQQPKSGGLQPWMLIVGALVMAALAFLLTRLLISG